MIQKFAFNQIDVGKMEQKNSEKNVCYQNLESFLNLRVIICEVEMITKMIVFLGQTMKYSDQSTFTHKVWSILIARFHFYILETKRTPIPRK